MDINKHLQCVLSSHNIENDEKLMSAYRAKRDEVRKSLEEKYAGQIHDILHSGSYKKKLGINLKFDMDLIMSFIKDCNKSLQELYDELFEYFNKEYRKIDPTLVNVRRQKVAIGLEFNVNGYILDLDIVPGREINDYPKDGDLNVYVSQEMGSFAKGSYIKTNIHKQIEQIRENAIARNPIKHMKVWKRTQNGPIKSFVLELAAIKALEGYDGPTDQWSVLKKVLEFLRDYIKTVRLIDPGNSGNVVSNTLADYQKQQISDAAGWILNSVERSADNIKIYFPVNPEYPCTEGKQRAYIVGTAGVDKLNNEDFG